MSKTLGIVAAVILTVSASTVWADGCYLPERAVRKIPEITAQRAVLSWKDGIETLVISSALDSEAQKLGWIIPLPAVPETMEKATPGALKTLDFCIQPKITHDLSQETRAAFWAVFVVNLLVGTWLFQRKRFAGVLLLLLLLFVLTGMLLPASTTAGAGAAKKARVRSEQTATVGSYSVSVLRPSQPDGLDAWLAENGFAALPEAAGLVIADYISNNWVFAAIKLRRSESGANVPHPIKLVFASKEAVYPMKLTAIAGGNPAFELFVVGKDRAACGALPVEFCDRFSREVDDQAESPVWYDGTNTPCNIGHAAIGSLMWNDCVLTKFHGTIDSARMTEDLRFSWKPFESHQEHFFTQYGAGCLGTILFLVLATGWNIVSMRDYARGAVRPKRLTSYAVKKLLPAVALGAIAGGGVYAVLPKLGNSEVQLSGRSEYWVYRFPGKLSELLSKNPAIFTRSEDEIAAFLLQAYGNNVQRQSPARNVITGADLIVEDSPGNFTVEQTPAGARVRVYDRFGRAHVIRPPSVPALIELLKAPDSRIRWNGTTALAEIGPAAEAALPALEKLLQDSDKEVREAAAKAIEKINTTESTP